MDHYYQLIHEEVYGSVYFGHGRWPHLRLEVWLFQGIGEILHIYGGECLNSHLGH